LNDRTVTFQLERDVYTGEELFIDYGFSYDRSMYGKPNSNDNDASTFN
jgi:SET domain-containing protein